MKQQTWRDRLRPLIAAVLAECREEPASEIRKRLRVAWDEALLGPREYWVYDVWLSECRRQLGTDKPKPTRKPNLPQAAAATGGQLTLLGETE